MERPSVLKQPVILCINAREVLCFDRQNSLPHYILVLCFYIFCKFLLSSGPELFDHILIKETLTDSIKLCSSNYCISGYENTYQNLWIQQH